MDVLLLLVTVKLLERHQIQRIGNCVEKKIGIEKFEVSDITFMAGPLPHMSIFVTFVAKPRTIFLSDVLFEKPYFLK